MVVGLYGGTGQMGQVLQALYRETEPETRVIIYSRSQLETLNGQTKPKVVIDFSHKDALEDVLAFCQDNGLPLVLATTGFDADQKATIKAASDHIPLFYSANLSLGIYVLKALAREAARMLDGDADIEIIERHHKHNKDAPSGTALLLKDAMAQTTAFSRVVYGREGQSHRQAGEIGIHAVRGGSIVGDHTVLFALDSEIIELNHRGESRKLFARGAMKAARFLTNQAPGLYGMDDLFYKENGHE